MRRALEYNHHRRSIRSDSLIGSSSACPSLFLANLRFCVHYCIDRDTVQKKKNSILKLENDLETNSKQTNVLRVDLTMRTLVMHTHIHTHTHTHTHVVCACVSVCVYMCACVRAWAGVRGQVGLCVGGWVGVV